MTSQLPIININSLMRGATDDQSLAKQIKHSCCNFGFFYIAGHGVDVELQNRLEALSREFFAQSLERKMEIRMALGGRVWRGYFPVGDELTSGQPDWKEGIYFGAELGAEHPLVKAGTPMHGANLFPAYPPQFRETVLEYMDAMTELGHRLMAGITLSLGLAESYFADRYTADPLTLFRIFNYPSGQKSGWGVGEHTDYGLLTILKQDDSGGLQVKSKSGWPSSECQISERPSFEWIDAPPIENTFVCNLGDMLDRMTGGLYRSTPHRVKNLIFARPPLVSLLLRSQFQRRSESHPAKPACRRRLRTSLGSNQRPRIQRNVRRLFAQQNFKSLSAITKVILL